MAFYTADYVKITKQLLIEHDFILLNHLKFFLIVIS